jgi:predicted nucleic acid-binding Zn ribbon protein
MNTTAVQKRYPGVKPFETAERGLFFGRDRDIEDLLDLIWLEKLVVLFGKSGYGKSSLLNAGILPEIEREAVPVVVRLGSYVAPSNVGRVSNANVGRVQNPSDVNVNPTDVMALKIEETLPNNPEADFIETLDVPKTLWHQLKRKQSAQNRQFVFIFDQFEEFFTYPLAAQQAFKEQLAELLYTEVPQAVRNRNDRLTPEQQRFIAAPFDAKVVFAIRADRMSLLDSMKDKLPAILQKRYELRGLTEAQAREAIEKPAAAPSPSVEVTSSHPDTTHGLAFASPPFTYSPEALKIMTQKLAETKSAQRSGIEAFQLQILCEYLEDKVIKGEIPGNRVESVHFADQIDEVFEGYYQRLLGKLDPQDRVAAQLLIEEKLLFEEEKTGEARRLSVDSGVLLAEKEVDQAMLNQLESNFLLRREATATGGFNYEVSHDTLIAPILKSKGERRASERAAAERQEAQRRRRRLLALVTIMALALALVIGVVLYVLKLRNNALDALAKAEVAQAAAIAERDKARQALADKEIAEFQDIYNRAYALATSERSCPSIEMMQAIDTMQMRYPQDTALQAKIRDFNTQLERRNKQCRE